MISERRTRRHCCRGSATPTSIADTSRSRSTTSNASPPGRPEGNASKNQSPWLWWRNTHFPRNFASDAGGEDADAGRMSDATEVRFEVQRGGRRRPRVAVGHRRSGPKPARTSASHPSLGRIRELAPFGFGAALPGMMARRVPAVAQGTKVGWALAADGAADRRARIAGGGLVVACILGAGACTVLLAN